MVRLLKLAVALLATGVLMGCLATESGDKSGDNASSGEVKFCLESLGGAGVSASVSGEATETTPASVALEYSTADGKETVSKTIELTPFGSGYITKKVISLDEGAYELTRFDVLDETGNTIYSTPTAGSDIATEVGIGTALSYRFTVAEGEINEIKMQVITVDDDTDPADFGHAAFTFEVVGYNRLYIDVLALIDSVGWSYVAAELSIADESGTVVKEVALNAEMNKVILPTSDTYILTISKSGYTSQTITLDQTEMEQYKLAPLVVTLEAGESAEEPTPIEPADTTTYAGESYTNSINMQMVRVAAGTFQMGSTDGESYEKPVHSVTISQDYYIGKYEVTQAQWVAVMGSNPSSNVGDNLPVECVSWNDIQEFITKLNEKEGTTKYRLPTEAQWEFAARGGNQSQGYTYSGSNTIGDVAWYAGSSTHTVGTKLANELGLYDMSGNVWEWCNDWYGFYSSDAVTDPSGVSTGSSRVLRGGYGGGNANHCRVAYRYCYNPSNCGKGHGFRLSSSL